MTGSVLWCLTTAQHAELYHFPPVSCDVYYLKLSSLISQLIALLLLVQMLFFFLFEWLIPFKCTRYLIPQARLTIIDWHPREVHHKEWFIISCEKYKVEMQQFCDFKGSLKYKSFTFWITLHCCCHAESKSQWKLAGWFSQSDQSN